MSVALAEGWVQDEPERLQGKDLGSTMMFSARPLSLHAAATFMEMERIKGRQGKQPLLGTSTPAPAAPQKTQVKFSA